jgi:hypothetical protein
VKAPKITSESDMALCPGYVLIAMLSTDGRSLDVRIAEDIIASLTTENIEKAAVLLRDAFYRVRPDLRKQ